MSDFTSEAVTIIIKKNYYMGKPTGWECDLVGQGFDGCGATGPTFASMIDAAFEIVTGKGGDYFDTPNDWANFDANNKGEQQ